MSRPRVLLADDHKAMVESLVRFLDQEVEIVGIVSDGQALVDVVRQVQPNVVVADISMPVKSGWDAFNELRTSGVSVPFVFLTASPDADLAAKVMRAGASFVLKYTASDDLLAAIREALEGGVFASALIRRRQEVRRLSDGDRATSY